jgi:predicted methyltransferase
MTGMLIDSFEARKILEAFDEGRDSMLAFFDLRFTQAEVRFRKGKIVIDDIYYDPEVIRKIAKNPAVFLVEDPPRIIAFFDESYYKLEPIENTAPTLEIDGIRMHRTKYQTPLEDARNKISLVSVSEGEDVLDICTGLGYTAIESYRKKARVITIEKDPNVIEIAEHNPYSRELFKGIEERKITLLNEDASEAIESFADESFNVILHDPPRFSLAGELYSGSFYRELYRVLREGGRMLHYVGKPGSRYRGKDFISGIEQRLTDCGFQTERTEDNESILAYK